MSTPTIGTAATPNLLFSEVPSPDSTKPVFKGAQRDMAKALLASSISEQRLMAVMQLVNKDPSLAFETLQVADLPGSNRTAPYEFPLACLRHRLSAGYVFAVGRGFSVDAPLQDGSTTLLQQAIAQCSAEQSGEADLSLLLAMGAKTSAMPDQDALYSVVANAFPAGGDRHYPGAVNMLLDAKVDFAYDPSFKCPYTALVDTAGWTVSLAAAALTKTMARFVKAGLSLERKTGSPKMTPVQRALGKKNGDALVSLIRVGAKTDPQSLGKDLFEVMRAQGLEPFIPVVQSALMEAHISFSSKAQAAAPPGATTAGESAATPSAAPPAAQRRRRVGLV